MHAIRLTLMLLLVLTMTATPAQDAPTGPIARVSALASGQLLLDGKTISLDELNGRFRELKQNDGEVWYYRENATAEATPIAMAVIQLVIEHGLPISLSSKPDFSDSIDESGRSQPRNP